MTSLADVHVAFRTWFGPEYDLDAINVVLATVAAERLGGDPLWLLLVSGPGNAKTETVQSLSGTGALIISTITSEGALLSATPARERAAGATGGLLQRLGPTGILVFKDFTSILSMHREGRAQIMAALREMHDGHWVRTVGSDGGQSLEWNGHIAVIGAVTTAWDMAHGAIAAMGDRFVIFRMDSMKGRQAAARQAMQNIGTEVEMRAELALVVEQLLSTIERGTPSMGLDIEGRDRLMAAADVVTQGRTSVEYDGRGYIKEAHAHEMPTRFLKQLGQVVRGAVAIGMDSAHAIELAMRCARDSMPPLRLSILFDVMSHPYTHVQDVRKRLDQPRTTISRELEALHLLRLLTMEETQLPSGKTQSHYTIAPHINPHVLEPRSCPGSSDLGEQRERGGDTTGQGMRLFHWLDSTDEVPEHADEMWEEVARTLQYA